MQIKDDELEQSLLNYAFDHKMKYKLTTELTPYAPSFTEMQTGTIVINMNWHDSAEIPFQIAHETAHVLNGDKPLYFPTEVSKSKIEIKANIRGIEILMPYYGAHRTEEYADPVQFCHFFRIPSHLFDVVDSKMKEYYGYNDIQAGMH